MGCERAYVAVQSALQAASQYDRITWILAAVAIIVAALGVMFTAASLVLALGAVRGWKELIGKATEAAETAAKAEAKKWSEIYSDPERMFAALGIKPHIDAFAPTPRPSAGGVSGKPIGEQLVEAMAIADEPDVPRDDPPVGEAVQEEPNARDSENTNGTESQPERERESDNDSDGGLE